MFRRNLPCFSLCPLPLVLSLDTTGKTLALSTLHPTFRFLPTQMRYAPKPSLLQAEQSQLAQPFLTCFSKMDVLSGTNS